MIVVCEKELEDKEKHPRWDVFLFINLFLVQVEKVFSVAGQVLLGAIN